MHLLYDADCGFCSRSASWLVAWGVPGVRSMQSVDLPALGVDAARAGREIPAVLPDGRVVYGARAIGEALRYVQDYMDEKRMFSMPNMNTAGNTR